MNVRKFLTWDKDSLPVVLLSCHFCVWDEIFSLPFTRSEAYVGILFSSKARCSFSVNLVVSIHSGPPFNYFRRLINLISCRSKFSLIHGLLLEEWDVCPVMSSLPPLILSLILKVGNPTSSFPSNLLWSLESIFIFSFSYSLLTRHHKIPARNVV